MIAIVVAGVASATTRTDIKVTRADIQASRQAIVAGNLPLTEQEVAA